MKIPISGLAKPKDQGGNHEAEDRADEKGFFGSPADALLSLQLFILIPHNSSFRCSPAGKAVVSSLSGSPLPKRSPPGYPGLSANSGYLFP